MRKIYLTLFGAMMMMAASAQSVVNGFKQDSIIVKTELGDYSKKTVYEYNADGQCTTSYGYAYQGGAYVLDGKTVNTFDEQGRATKYFLQITHNACKSTLIYIFDQEKGLFFCLFRNNLCTFAGEN